MKKIKHIIACAAAFGAGVFLASCKPTTDPQPAAVTKSYSVEIRSSDRGQMKFIKDGKEMYSYTSLTPFVISFQYGNRPQIEVRVEQPGEYYVVYFTADNTCSLMEY